MKLKSAKENPSVALFFGDSTSTITEISAAV